MGGPQEEQPQQLPPDIPSSPSVPQQRSESTERDLEAAFPDLPMQRGRPHVAAVLRRHLEQHPETRDVAVFVAGEQAHTQFDMSHTGVSHINLTIAYSTSP